MGPLDDHHKGDRFGVRDARGRLVLDADAAAELNAIHAELHRLDRVQAAAPLTYASDAAGRRWGVSRRPQVYAKLSGTGSPYTWAEAVRAADGTSSLVSGGRTGSAYEVNAVSGLTGKYATLDWTPAGDWRFQAIRGGATATTTTLGRGCSIYCSSLPLAITLTPQPGNSGNYYDVTTIVNFTTTGPTGDPLAVSALTNAGDNSTNCWWSTLLSDGSGVTGHGFYWVFNCGPYVDGSGGGYGHMSFVHKIGTSGTIADYATVKDAYLFDLTSSCSPFLMTGSAQSTFAPNEKWTASG